MRQHKAGKPLKKTPIMSEIGQGISWDAPVSLETPNLLVSLSTLAGLIELEDNLLGPKIGFSFTLERPCWIRHQLRWIGIASLL